MRRKIAACFALLMVLVTSCGSATISVQWTMPVMKGPCDAPARDSLRGPVWARVEWTRTVWQNLRPITITAQDSVQGQPGQQVVWSRSAEADTYTVAVIAYTTYGGYACQWESVTVFVETPPRSVGNLRVSP